MKGKREADNNFNSNFKSEKLDELRSRVDAAFDEHGDEAWEQIKGIFTHPKRLLVAALAAVLLVGVITVGGYLLKIRAPGGKARTSTRSLCSAATRAEAATPTRCCSRATM